MATSPIYNWPEPDNTDLVKNGALAMRTLGDAIDTTMATMTPKSIVDAKGDLIAASAADTPARLAVGANGETLVADSSTSTGLRYTNATTQNPVINSAFDVWQRGTSIAGSLTAYGADRWKIYTSNTNTTMSRQSVSDTTNLPIIRYCARVGRNSGNATTSNIHAIYGMETADAIRFAGQTVTYSFYARAGANYSSTSSGLTMAISTGTGTDETPTSYTGNVEQTTAITLTTTWQRFTTTKTLAAGATEIGLWAYYAPTGTAGANDYFEITGVQLDVGSVALPYRRYAPTIAGELIACQRYFERIAASSASNGAAPFATGWAISTTKAVFMMQTRVQKRTTPTVTFSGATDFRVYDFISTLETTSAIIATGATYMDVEGLGNFMIEATTAGTLTAFRPFGLIPAGGSGTRSISISAEL
jgi:hypothetical protein